MRQSFGAVVSCLRTCSGRSLYRRSQLLWPKRLGNFPFWRGEERFLDAITPVYTQASPRGLELFLGERNKE